jgi:hypothetical protein
MSKYLQTTGRARIHPSQPRRAFPGGIESPTPADPRHPLQGSLRGQSHDVGILGQVSQHGASALFELTQDAAGRSVGLHHLDQSAGPLRGKRQGIEHPGPQNEFFSIPAVRLTGGQQKNAQNCRQSLHANSLPDFYSMSKVNRKRMRCSAWRWSESCLS